jgi:DNA-binding NarL/FixJ family response regulator
MPPDARLTSQQIPVRPERGARVRVIIADDQPLFREFLKRMLETAPMLKVVGEAADGHEAVWLTRQLKPDLVLMNIDMPQADGLDATREIKASHAETKVILLSSVGDTAHNRVAMECGAEAFLAKGAPVAKLLSVVQGVLNAVKLFT